MALVYKVTVTAADKPGLFNITWLDRQKGTEESFPAPSSGLSEAELTRLWYERPHQLAIGQKLFAFIDGERRILSSALDQARKKDQPLILQLVTGPETDNWPFELLADAAGFLLLNRLHLVRCTGDWGKDKSHQPANQALSLLFMACSALDVKPELDFEKEEEAILSITEGLPMDIEVEDSGSAEGLHEKLLHRRYDVVHLSGHAGIDGGGTPFFIMEDETGREERVDPGELWQRGLYVNPPQVLFLSGCQTGENPVNAHDDETGTLLSFARSLARLEKIPAILGWGRPVGDTQATLAETIFYRELSRGQGVLEAVQQAREKLFASFFDILSPAWPLLRVFSGEMYLGALVKEGQAVKPRAREMQHRYLKEGQVKILTAGFVGRRRQVQAGIKALTKDKEKYGLVLHGLGGLGKSCLAGKLCERFKDYHLVVVHGKLNAVSLEKALKEAFLVSRDETGKQILTQPKEMQEKLAELCVSAFKEKNYLILLDDFEQNQEGYDKGRPGPLWPEAAELLFTLLHYLPYSHKLTQLMITGRYIFTLPDGDKDLVGDRLQAICLTSFKETEQRKKVRELPHIFSYIYTAPQLVAGLTGLGRGNPRLMEWIDTLVGQMPQAGVEELIVAVKDKQEEFIRGHVLRELLALGGPGLAALLARLGLFRRPVLRQGVQAAGLSANISDWAVHLDRGLGLGLVEHDQARDLYEVTPMLKDELAAGLSGADQLAGHKAGFDYYGQVCGSLDYLDPVLHEEWVYHALACGEEEAAVDKGGDLVKYLRENLAFRESRRVGEWVLREKKSPLATEGDALLLSELGYTVQQMGDNRSASDYFTQALNIYKNVYGENHQHVAAALNNLGAAWDDLGKKQKAIDYYTQSLAIWEKVYGKEHPQVATALNNLGAAYQALGQNKEAITYFERALAIWEKVYGKEHPQVAAALNNLGAAYFELGEKVQARLYFERAYAIKLKFIGPDHPSSKLTQKWLDLCPGE